MTDPDKLSAALTMIEALGLDPAELADALSSASMPSMTNAPLMRDYIETVSRTLTEGTRRGFTTHFMRLRDGVTRQCTCTCDACLDEFAKHATCSCTCSSCSSAIDSPPMGELAVTRTNFRRSTLEPLVTIAQRMSSKKAHLDNRSRARRGLPPKHVHGQGGQEMCVTALRALFGRAVDDELLTTNPAEKLNKGTRSETVRRALTIDEIEELFDEVVTGGDDPDLDFAIVWLAFEAANRRDGGITSTTGSILRESQQIRLLEKGNKERIQPISSELIDFLFALAIERGGPRCDPNSEEFDPRSPLFYYKDSTSENPHPLTRKRYETLFGRIQRRFPWAAETQFTAHALRHTTATLVERNFNNQVARKYLGHGSRTATDSYTKASSTEVATAFSVITGHAHPDAKKPDRP